MPWTVTSGTITGVAGSLITLLDTELVTNRGWTKAFSGTNKAAYRNSASALARSYFRVLDDASLSGAGRDAAIRGYYTMSDVDTGTGEYPTVAETSAMGGAIRKSATADSTARSYIAAGDDRTLLLFIASGDVAGSYITHYFGDGDPMVSGDTSFRVLLARWTSVSASITSGSIAEAPYMWQVAAAGAIYSINSTYFNAFIGGPSGGASGSARATLLAPPGAAGGLIAGINNLNYWGGMSVYPSIRGAVELGDLILATDGGGGGASLHIRGRLRGLFIPMHSPTGFGDGDTFNGTDGLAGNSFRIVKSVRSWTGTSSGLITGAAAISTNEPPSYL